MNTVIETNGTNAEIESVYEKGLTVLNQYNQAKDNLKELEKQAKAVETALYKAMEKNDVKSFETDEYKFTLVAPTDTMVINTQKLKDEGMYEYFKDKPQHRSGYVKYTKKKAEVTA